MPDCQTIVIVDDHPLVREGLKGMLARDSAFSVIGEANGIHEAMELMQQLRPDMAVIDLALADGDGLDLIKRLKAHDPELKILACSMREESLFAERALNAGALGYIHKSEVAQHILDAVRATLKGRVYLSPEMVERVLNGLSQDQPPDALPVESLSDRELQVFGLIGSGRSTADIALQLHLSVKTIETHREKIKRKLKLRNASQLMQQAMLWELKQC